MGIDKEIVFRRAGRWGALVIAICSHAWGDVDVPDATHASLNVFAGDLSCVGGDRGKTEQSLLRQKII